MFEPENVLSSTSSAVLAWFKQQTENLKPRRHEDWV